VPYERQKGARMIAIKNKHVRRALNILLPALVLPLIVLLGAIVFREKGYAFVSLAVAVAALCYFITGFEKKRTGTRRLIIVAVMTALSVAGRFIPLFKPVSALTIIAGVYLGSESGFLVGALSAVISNFYFGQGPWTPFQMLAWGLVGLLAGVMGAFLKRNRLYMALFGVLCGIVFSFVMDIWTVLWYNGQPSAALYLSALISAAPVTALYSVSNAVFLWFLAPPFGEKLERVKLKYGV